jgi:NitT/TauT family transport system substrate-binding protein
MCSGIQQQEATMRYFIIWLLAGVVVVAQILLAETVFAQERLKLAIAQRGNWDSSIPELGTRAGVFKKHGLDLDLLYTQGAGETLQAVISGSADIGVAVGTLGVLGAFAKGAPVRVIGAQATGVADFWYVRADSKLTTIKDATEATTIAYSATGASTHTIARGFVRQYGLKSKLVATGGPQVTFTQVMSGQVDVGWSSPPFALDALKQNRIRIIGRGNDIPEIRSQTVRLLIASKNAIEKRGPAIDQFMTAYRETLDWMYATKEATEEYAKFADVPTEIADDVRSDFFPKERVDPDSIKNIEGIMATAIEFKSIAAPLSKEQLAELIRIPPRK